MKISNQVQCDSINSNNTSHASACILIKHKNSSMKHTVTLHYPTINMVGFEYLWCHCNFSHGKGRKKLHSIRSTAVLPYYGCQNMCVDGGRFFAREDRVGKTAQVAIASYRSNTETQIMISSTAADRQSIVLSHRQIPLSQLGSLCLQCCWAHLPLTHDSPAKSYRHLRSHCRCGASHLFCIGFRRCSVWTFLPNSLGSLLASSP